jgi:ATP-dependent DNA helicase PIF1
MDVLTPDQLKAYNLMISGHNVFITGGGGVGKSHIINLFRQKNPDRVIGVTSTTGISAILIGGTTLHSYLGIGLGKEDVQFLARKIRRSKLKIRRWKTLQTLIIDEISMLSPDLFDKLEEIARILRKTSKPFGGIQLILSGDFLQLPCVNTELFCFEAKTWDKCVTHTVYLKQLIRQSDIEFQNCLNAIRIGKIEDKHKAYLEERIGKSLKNDAGIEPTILFPKNSLVDIMNNKMLQKQTETQREVCEYEMITDKLDILHSQLPGYSYEEYRDFLHEVDKEIERILKEILIPPKLHLCIGCQVMLTYNLDIDAGLVNGSKGKVVDINEDGIPIVRFKNGNELTIDFYTWEFTKEDIPFFHITQIPLKLAYSFSIHKSQGSTLDLVEVDLSDIFEYGMAYVALSRVKDIEGLTIKNINWSKIKAHPKAVEYYESI